MTGACRGPSRLNPLRCTKHDGPSAGSRQMPQENENKVDSHSCKHGRSSHFVAGLGLGALAGVHSSRSLRSSSASLPSYEFCSFAGKRTGRRAVSLHHTAPQTPPAATGHQLVRRGINLSTHHGTFFSVGCGLADQTLIIGITAVVRPDSVCFESTQFTLHSMFCALGWKQLRLVNSALWGDIGITERNGK